MAACSQSIPSPIAKDIVEDGPIRKPFGYSAIALIAIAKNFFDTPYPVGTATIKNNELKVSVGDCYTANQTGGGCYGYAYLGAFYPPGANFFGITFTGNYVEGNTIQAAQIANYNPGGGGFPANYSGNILGPYSSCAVGTSC